MLKSTFRAIRRFFTSLGLVEQAQVVASTAVIVAMITIITTRLVIGAANGLLDFITVITIGVFGFVSIFFALKYGRILEQQRRELFELNTIAEAVNHSVELDPVFQSSLAKVMELLNAEFGWIYTLEQDVLQLRYSSGTRSGFFPPGIPAGRGSMRWIERPGVITQVGLVLEECASAGIRTEGLRWIASIPLVRQSSMAGVLIVGSVKPGKSGTRNIAIMQAFGNQISTALNNAYLFEQVRRSEQEYADLYEQSPDMYLSIGSGGTIMICNFTGCELLGRPKEDIIGSDIRTLYPSQYIPTLELNLRKMFERGQELSDIEEQVCRGDGSLIDVSVNTSLVRDENGNPRIARMVMRDITEKKKLEAKILQAQKIDSLGNITGGIAHDFNNILTAILGAASIMRRKTGDDGRLLKYIELIEQTSRRGATMVRQLMTFARKHPPHIDRIDIRTIIEQTLKIFEVSAPKSIHVKYTPGSETLIVEGDEIQLQQALWNLFLNAKDAMLNGGILVITCSAQTVGEDQADTLTDGRPGTYVVVNVADSGTGIPASVLPHIFEPFFTTKEKEKGSGLGLSVVYGVIKGHGGAINVSSEVNSGTQFTIYLPRVFVATGEQAAPRDRTTIIGGTERILIVEDEISVGEVGGAILSDLGYSVRQARNGREAMEILGGEKKYDMVILDMNMPRMGGRATFNRIKEKFPFMRVLVCSGYSATMLDDGRFTDSIDGFIQKPYELEEFAYRVRTILDSPPRSTAPILEHQEPE